MSDKGINQMDFKELRKEVQSLRDELAIMQRKYEDILYNIDYENLGVEVKKDLTSVVSSIDNYSTISQTDDKISMVVSKSVSAKFTMNVKPTSKNTSDDEKGMICEYNETLYYYNNISETWVECPYESEIKSFFEQTSDGFKLIGDVSVSGKIMATDNNESYSQMTESGFDVFVNGGKKVGIGCHEGNASYPYVILGAGINEDGRNRGCIYKLGQGVWIGDESLIEAGGDYPGGESSVTDINWKYPQATGIFINLRNSVIYRYNAGSPQPIT